MKEIRALIRSGRPAKRWADHYVTVFALLVAAVVAAKPVGSALTTAARQATPAQVGAGSALIVAGYAAFLALSRALGPVVVPPADAAWLVLTPLPRRSVLSRTVPVLLAVSITAGLALGLALPVVTAAPGHLVAALVLGVAAATGGMAWAVLAQSSAAWDAWLQVTLAALVLVAVLCAVAPHLLPSVPIGPVAVACAAAAALLLRRAWSALARMPARILLAASTRTGDLARATTNLDPSGLAWIAEDAHWRARDLRSRSWPRRLPVPLSLAWTEVCRLARRPGPQALLLLATLLPMVASRAGFSAPTLLLVAAGGLAAAMSVTSGARRDAGDPTLARLLGVGSRQALAARALPPVLLAAAWTTLALTCLDMTGPWLLLGVLCAPAAAAGALRMARRHPVDHSMPLIDTGMGTIPSGPVLWALTGVDIALLGALPALQAALDRPAHLGGYLAAQALWGVAVLAAYVWRSAPR
ncbi:hypothetical protein Ssi03_05980 [Sphaerisporangium siamense]|uniref:Uncharacterized protein n=1 Tax=Sphaerisporangium siamense TaxID=795645 RepID=A0A7W7DC63_9ACTN|nr:DUF6297 family protein [Sphaerisporangium siamense]MBB4704130.1 hypothetical protein [Sphaerisporangium siamense]GII82608.1 hypothetical protein Ssi03_05980 [Sphaerisporangium siamense]